MKTTSEWRPPRNEDHLGMKTTSEWRPPQNEDHLGMKTTSEWRPPQNKDHLRIKTTFQQYHKHGQVSPASLPSHARPNWDGQVMSPACMTTTSPSSSSMENFVMANAQSEANVNASMTASKSLWKTSLLARSPGSHLPPTDPAGAASSPKEPSQWKSTELSKQSRKEPHTRPKLLALHQHQPTTARLVGKAPLPRLASSATFGHTTATLLTDHAHGHLRQWRTNNNNNKHTLNI